MRDNQFDEAQRLGRARYDEFWEGLEARLSAEQLAGLKQRYVEKNLIRCVTGDSNFAALLGMSAERQRAIREEFVGLSSLQDDDGTEVPLAARQAALLSILTDQERSKLPQ